MYRMSEVLLQLFLYTEFPNNGVIVILLVGLIDQVINNRRYLGILWLV